jgi:hypothetical protein
MCRLSHSLFQERLIRSFLNGDMEEKMSIYKDLQDVGLLYTRRKFL